MNKKLHKKGSIIINKWHIVFVSVNLLVLNFPSFLPVSISQSYHMFSGLLKPANLVIILSHSVLHYIFLGIT